MKRTNPKVDLFLSQNPEWREESRRLRAISLACGLTEELKWGKPCYTYQGSNVVIIQGFKECCALLFCKGALLKDPEGILEKPGENTQGGRRIRFTQVRDIGAMMPVLRAYILEAIAAEKSGLKVDYKPAPEPMPKELQEKFDHHRALKAAFEGLTPGRQRAYILYFSGAKQSMTRESRIDKCTRRILEGRGLND